MYDYLPKEAFNAANYVLLMAGKNERTILITDIPKLGELMDGLCISKQCRRINKRVAMAIKNEIGNEAISSHVGNVEIWHGAF